MGNHPVIYVSLETVRELCNDARLDAAQIASI
jgi:hypothetical protein